MEQIPASKILDALRCVNTEDLLVALQQEHPTNQQLLAKNVFSIIKQWFEKYEEGNYDGRNEATVSIAYDMINGTKELTKDRGIYLPYI